MFLSATYPMPPSPMEFPYANEPMEQSSGSETNTSGVRSRRRISELPCCPVCGCTLRAGELQAHLTLELDRLAKLSVPPPKRRAVAVPSTSFGSAAADANAEVDTSGCTGSDVYERVKKNREKRLRAGRGRGDTVTCPICNFRLSVSTAEAHVDACLKKFTGKDDEDEESIDVEGESDQTSEDRFGVSYEWCSQVRVRASALQLLDGGELPHGAMRIRRASTDTHLVVDGDEDDLLYGPPQYSPSRIVPQDQNDSNIDLESHRNSSESNGEVTRMDSQSESNLDNGNSKCNSDTYNETVQNGCHNIVVEALKSRIREMEQQLEAKRNRTEIKCLICIGPYNEPVISVQCWHVYCEACWLASLGAKKTCPQCNTITTAQHLRRIYL